jgi:hypothetical protein
MDIKDAYNFLYYDLVSNTLEVVLVPSQKDDIGSIRAVCSKNPAWYQDLCKMYLRSDQSPRKKKKRTIVKRIEVLRVLDRLRKGKSTRSQFLWYLHDIAQSIAENDDISEADIQFFEQYGELPEPFRDQF